MAWSELDIVNIALNILNKKSVDSLSEAGEFADSASRAFDILYPSEIAGFSWRFATKIVQLSQQVDAPPIQNWNYIYLLPSDYLATVRLYPASDFQIYSERQLYSNINSLQMEYRFLPLVTHLPSYFVNYFAMVLAQRFANSVAADGSLSDQLEKKVVDMRGQALFIDSQNHPTPSIVSKPLINARSNGTYWENSYLNGNG